jgi:hypothetical protein
VAVVVSEDFKLQFSFNFVDVRSRGRIPRAACSFYERRAVCLPRGRFDKNHYI